MVTKEMVLDCMEKNPELIQIGAYQDEKAVPVSKDTPIEDLACTIGGQTFRFGKWKDERTVLDYLSKHSKDDMAQDIASMIEDIRSFGEPSEAMHYECAIQAELDRHPTLHEMKICDAIEDAFETAIENADDVPLYFQNDHFTDDVGVSFTIGIDDDIQKDESHSFTVPYENLSNLPLALE